MSRFIRCWASAFLLLAPNLLGAEVNVLNFGAVPNDGGDDTGAFAEAVTAGDVVVVPAGVYNITISGRVAINCPQSVQIVGAGRDLTFLVTEATLTATGAVMLFRPGTKAVVSGLTVVGPSDYGVSGCNAILHYGGKGGSLTVQNCGVTQGRVGVKMEELNGRQDKPQLTITDSVLEAPTCTLMLNSGTCNVVRTTFRGYGRSGSNQDHAIYTYLPVNLVVDTCTFLESVGNGFDVHPYSPLPGRGSVLIRYSSFPGSATGQGILTHPATRTTIDHCQLGTTSAYVQAGGAAFSFCTLQSRAQVVPWPYNPGTWTFRNCTFLQ